MPLTVSNWTGDGIYDPQIVASIELPDSGTSVNVTGTVQAIAGPVVTITGSPLTIPAAPAAGSVFYIIEVNTTNGTATVVQSTTAMPAADPGNQVIFQQTLVPASTDAALVPTTTPTTY